MAAEKKKKKKKGGPVNAILTLGILLCVGVIAYSGYKLISTHLLIGKGKTSTAACCSIRPRPIRRSRKKNRRIRGNLP